MQPYEIRVMDLDTKFIEENVNGIAATDIQGLKKYSNTSFGVFATQNIPMGSIVVKLEGEWQAHPCRVSIQVGERHLLSSIGSSVNHHCSANTLLMIAIQSLDGKIGVVPWYSRITGTLSSMVIGNPYPVLVSTTAISIDDEITFNYNHSETLLSNPFKCSCCNTWIRGKNYSYE